MPSPRITQTLALQARLAAALSISGLSDVLVTLDGRDVSSASRDGAVLIDPPTLRFETFAIDAEAVYEVHVIAGVAHAPFEAWERIDEIIAALQKGNVNIQKAAPASFAPAQGEAIPAYTLTLNPYE